MRHETFDGEDWLYFPTIVPDVAIIHTYHRAQVNPIIRGKLIAEATPTIATGRNCNDSIGVTSRISHRDGWRIGYDCGHIVGDLLPDQIE